MFTDNKCHNFSNTDISVCIGTTSSWCSSSEFRITDTSRRQMSDNKVIKRKENVFDNQIPARIDAMAAIRKLRITDGPAVSWATCPTRIYVPVPSVEPIPTEKKTGFFCFWSLSLLLSIYPKLSNQKQLNIVSIEMYVVIPYHRFFFVLNYRTIVG